MQVDAKAFEYAISKINEGEIFENFSLSFLPAVLGYDFIPVAGSKDRGVDAFQHVFKRSSNEKIIFQISTEKGFEGKIFDTIKKLNQNKIAFSKIIYVTNRKINGAEGFVDEVFDQSSVHLTIYDIRWFTAHCNESEKTVRAYQGFVDTYLHEYEKPGKYQAITNLAEDSRIYIFLAQQFDQNRTDLKLDSFLADTLILYGLEGTDPDKGLFLTKAEITEKVRKYLKFDPQLINEKLSERLQALSKKPRKINYHLKEDAYCLPYETRFAISQRNLLDEVLYNSFYQHTTETIKKFFVDLDINVRDVEKLIQRVLNKIFTKQGLEFSNFVLHGDSKTEVEKNLNDVISEAVDESAVIVKNKQKVKTALHLAIRDIVYKGTDDQRRFLRSLSNTYLMMFLLQWEPRVAIYFNSLASQLSVFVDNSIIIPALSEYYLAHGNKRHWSLLTGARKAGIKMFINDTLLNELVHHFRMIKNKYYSYFEHQEKYYLNDEFELLFIDDILIRAYFYGKRNGDVKHFDDFIDNFVDPSLTNTRDELITLLYELFGIKHISNEAWDIQIDSADKATLQAELRMTKNNDTKAAADAEMILAIYYLRRKHNEASDKGIFGYKTWWLSKDINTYKAVTKVFGRDRFPVSCYIRPDFIYNYIAFTPSVDEVTDAYAEIFPTMLGVNLSYHMPKEISQAVQEKLRQYHDREPARVKQIIKNLSDQLKVDPKLKTKQSVELFLDRALKKVKTADNQQ